MRRCALVSGTSDMLTERAVTCISLLIFPVCSDCGSMYVFHALFDMCKCGVFVCFDDVVYL